MKDYIIFSESDEAYYRTNTSHGLLAKYQNAYEKKYPEEHNVTIKGKFFDHYSFTDFLKTEKKVKLKEVKVPFYY
jgi:hypothetical protein